MSLIDWLFVRFDRVGILETLATDGAITGGCDYGRRRFRARLGKKLDGVTSVMGRCDGPGRQARH